MGVDFSITVATGFKLDETAQAWLRNMFDPEDHGYSVADELWPMFAEKWGIKTLDADIAGNCYGSENLTYYVYVRRLYQHYYDYTIPGGYFPIDWEVLTDEELKELQIVLGALQMPATTIDRFVATLWS